jgi:hypothetical protein
MGRLIHAVLLRRFRMLRKSGSLITIVFAVSTLLFAQNTKAASTDTAFDGTWSVTVNYHEYKNPDGVKSQYSRYHQGNVRGDLG